MVGRPVSFFVPEVTAISQTLSSLPESPVDIRRRSVAAILAAGIQRLHDASVESAVVESVDDPASVEPVSRNLADSLPERLDAVRSGGLSVTGVSETTGFETGSTSETTEMKHAK